LSPEAWLRGPIAGIDPLLQPAAHSFIEVLEDLPPAIERLSDEDLWASLGRSAPIGYHLAHLAGSVDRLLTYARGESLSPAQQSALDAERKSGERRPSRAELLRGLRATLEQALAQLRATRPDTLLEIRYVGRARLPSTTLGVLFHAGEHATRHAGQIRTLMHVLERP